MEVDIVKQPYLDATKTKTIQKQSLIALVMNLVAPVDIMMNQLISTTASPALIHYTKSTHCMMMEVENV